MTYDEWENQQGISWSLGDPEAYYAELAWNAAIKEVLQISQNLYDQEIAMRNPLTILMKKYKTLDTGFK